MKKLIALFLLVSMMLTLMACGNMRENTNDSKDDTSDKVSDQAESESNTEGTGDANTDTDTNTDTDANTDTDTGADTDADTDTDTAGNDTNDPEDTTEPTEDVPVKDFVPESMTECIRLGSYKGYSYTPSEVTEEMVQQYITELEVAYAELEEVDRAADDTDTVIINFTGYIDGETFEGGSAKNYELTIGEASMIDGFVEGLLGMKAGEKKTLHLQFPDPYQNNPDLAGSPVDFEIEMVSVKVYVNAVVDDEFIARESNGRYQSVQHYLDYVEYSLNVSADETIFADICERILINSEILAIPESMVSEYAQLMLEQYSESLSMYGIDLESYLSMLGTTMEEFEAQIRESAVQYAKQEIVVLAIAESENLTISEEEYADGLEYFFYLDGYGYDTAEAYEQAITRETIENSLLRDKVLNFVIDNCTPMVS